MEVAVARQHAVVAVPIHEPGRTRGQVHDYAQCETHAERGEGPRVHREEARAERAQRRQVRSCGQRERGERAGGDHEGVAVRHLGHGGDGGEIHRGADRARQQRCRWRSNVIDTYIHTYFLK